MGCTVSLEFLRRNPFGAARVVLHNGPLRLTRADDFPHAMPADQLAGYLDTMEQGWPGSEREFLAESILDTRDEGLLQLLLTVALQTPLDIALKAVRNQAQIDHRPAVRDLRIPVLAAYADHDPYYPISLAEWIAASAARGTLAVLHASAHCAPLEEPETPAEIVSGFALRAAG